MLRLIVQYKLRWLYLINNLSLFFVTNILLTEMMQITLKWNETFDYLVLVYYFVKKILKTKLKEF